MPEAYSFRRCCSPDKIVTILTFGIFRQRNMAIVTIDESSPYLTQVLNLARLNSSTLGFLPRAAFLEAARQQRLLVAINVEGDFLGYLLYGISAKVMLAYIVHLCVRPSIVARRSRPNLFKC